MITVPEAARRVGRNPETIRRWIREGKLRSSRVGTQHLVDENELDAFARDADLIPSKFDEDTITGRPMPDLLGILRRQRSEH